MNYAGWVEIWHSTVALVARAPTFTQIMIWLGVAFAIVMCLEGLRVSFLPRSWLATRMTRAPFTVPPKFEMPVRMAAMPSSAASFSRSFELREKPLRTAVKTAGVKQLLRNRKKMISRVRRTRPIKPQIRRYPSDPVPEPRDYILPELTLEPMHEAPSQM